MNVGERKKRLLFLILAVTALIMLMASATLANKQNNVLKKKIDGKLLQKMAKAKPGQKFDVVIKLQSAAKTAKSTESNKPRSIKEINSITKRTQGNVLESLRSAKTKGQVGAVQSLWITNAIVVNADGDVVKSLAQRPEVKAIFPNFKVSLAKPIESKTSFTGKPGTDVSVAAGNEWNITKVKAPTVWNDLSVTGAGTKIAVLDTGIDPTHPDLLGKVDSNFFVEVDEYGNVTPTTPKDTDRHGTHVAGTIAGGDAGGTAIGVAPGTQLIGAIALPYGYATFAQLMGAMQWAADPDGDLGTTADRPDAANMSFGGGQLLAQMYEPIDNMVAAGVVPVAAVGNWGSGEVSAPSDVPTAFAIGATDTSDNVGWFSGGGEVTWYDAPYEGTYTKPDASAPGVNVKSAIPGGSYASYSGTSMATPHVAGAVALLRSLRPNLSVEQISRILQQTAIDLGETSKDTRYGSGRIDILAAATLANSFGTARGTVSYSTEPLTSAVVQLVKMPEDEVVTSVKTDKNGTFVIEGTPGDYKLVVSKYGFELVEEATFTLVANETMAFTYDMAIADRYTLSGAVRKAADGTALNGEVEIVSPTKEMTAAVSGNYSFSVPNGEYSVKASAYGYKDKELTVTINDGNGTLDFDLDPVSPMLLVVDIGAGDYANYFTTALDSLGYTYDVLELDVDEFDLFEPTSTLDASYFNQYKKIVWAAGDGPAMGTLSSYDMDEDDFTPPALAEYLDKGGKLFLSGQDVAYFMDWSINNLKAGKADFHEEEDDDEEYIDFLSDYLYSRILADKSKNLAISGLPDTIFAGKNMDLLSIGGPGENGAKNQFWPDVLKTSQPAIPELAYTAESIGAASLRTYSGTNSKGKVVYFGFGFEGIDNTADRLDTMSRAINWLDTVPGTLTIGTLKPQVFGMGSTVISGKLTPGLVGQEIVIEQKMSYPMGGYYNGYPDDGTPVWVPIDVAYTDVSGNWSKKVYPDINTSYRAVWNGNVDTARTISSGLKIKVKPKITARPEAGTVVAGSKVTINGRVEPAVYGTMVSVMSKNASQNSWTYVKMVEVDDGGDFSVKVTPRVNISYKFVIDSSPELLGSSLTGIHVKAKHNLTLAAETGLAPSGLPIYFSGKVYPKHPGAYVDLQIKEAGVWKSIQKVKLGSEFSWRTLYKSDKKGTYAFRVVLEKDSLHETGISNNVIVRFY